MALFICTACGTQYPESAEPPAQCAICEEERQYVPPGGQTWTTLPALARPHFNTTMVEWAHAFDCPIHLHAADRAWIMRPDPAIKLWAGDTFRLWDGVTLIRCGGHFEGGTVLHWAGGANGRGVVCAGDVLTVATDRKWLSFMRSYPNFIPLSRAAVEHIGATLEPFSFDTIYGHYFDRVITTGGKTALRRSIERYVAAIEG